MQEELIMDSDYVIGIDIGGTNFRAGAITKDLKMHHPKKISSRKLFDSTNPILILSDFISSYMDEIKEGSCRGICLGFPGTVDKKKKIVYSCPNLPTITNLDIGGRLQQRFHIPVLAEHDVILLLANDMKSLDLYGFDCIISLYVGTGLGNALYIHGRFLDGKNGVAGELGHIPVLGKVDPCPCGNTGCMELYCAGKRLEKIHADFFADVNFEEVFDHFTETNVLANYIDCLAVACATEVNILDPDCILLSGGVIHMKNFPYNYLLERIRHYTRKPFPASLLRFEKGISDPFSGVLGCGIYMWNSL